MSCSNFCTAEKCAELEERIGALEQALALLEASFEAHTTQQVKEAHNYTPEVDYYLGEYEGTLYSYVCVDDVCVNQNAAISSTSISIVELEIIDLETTGHYDFVLTIGEIQATSTLIIEYPLIELTLDSTYYENTIELNLIGSGYAGNIASQTIIELNQLTIEDDGENSEHVVSDLNVNLTYQNDSLTVIVSDGESSGSDSVLITSSNSGGDGGSSLSCEQKIEDCCGQILAAISGVSTQITDAQTILSAENLEIKNELTIDVTGTLITDYEHEFELDDDEDIIPTYAISKYKEETYDHKGLTGIHELLKIILENQTQLHLVGAEGISPPVKVDLSSTVDGLCSTFDLKTQDDFDDEKGFLDYILDIVRDKLSNSISKFLLKRIGYAGGLPGMVVSTSIDWGIGFLIDKLTVQEQVASTSICDAIENLELDTVTLVASEKDVGKIESKVLTLHFVGMSDYPKRTSNKGIRPIHIPAPKSSYDWSADFESIRWYQGNQYAKMTLEGYKQPICGWFKDVDSANATLDQLLNLTTATQKNRVIPIHLNPRTDIVERESRPYRAFVSQEVIPGQPETLTKYVPPKNEE